MNKDFSYLDLFLKWRSLANDEVVWIVSTDKVNCFLNPGLFFIILVFSIKQYYPHNNVKNFRPLFHYFGLFNRKIQSSQQSDYPSSIRYWDLNSRPLDLESPPVTTRPGFTHLICFDYFIFFPSLLHVYMI